MAVRVVKQPQANAIFHDQGVIRMDAKSMFSGSGEPLRPVGAPSPNADMDVAHDAWEQELKRRERAAGLPESSQSANEPLPVPGPGRYVERTPTPSIERVTDITGLPERFTLEIERKGEWWKITAPTVHVGLFVAHQDLIVALSDAPGALAAILRLDGELPRPKRGRKI